MTEKKQKSAWKKFLQSMTKAHDLGKEEEILISDHEYDGIKELDNVLPPWWKYGFYITILVGVFYYIQVFTNAEEYSQEQEFLAEVEKGKAEVEAYKAANPDRRLLPWSAREIRPDALLVSSRGRTLVKGCRPMPGCRFQLYA